MLDKTLELINKRIEKLKGVDPFYLRTEEVWFRQGQLFELELLREQLLVDEVVNLSELPSKEDIDFLTSLVRKLTVLIQGQKNER
jgi:hypothetical protein